MPSFSVIGKAYRGFNKAIEVVSVVILVLVTIVVIYSVLLRYAFKSPLAWSEEVARYMFIWMVFLGMSVAERTGDHFRIEVFIEMVPAKIRIFIEIILNILIFYALFILFREGVNYYEQGKTGLSTILEMPLNYIYVALPLAMVLTVLNRIETVRVTMKMLFAQARSGGKPEEPESATKGLQPGIPTEEPKAFRKDSEKESNLR